MHHPRILFLDEPTVGVDVQTRHSIIDFLKGLNKEGTTLVYTSHPQHSPSSEANSGLPFLSCYFSFIYSPTQCDIDDLSLQARKRRCLIDKL